MTFDIRDHLDRLEVVKETTSEYHCKCPICGDGGFKIQKNTGAYQAFKCEHNTPDDRSRIRDIVAPIEKKEVRPRQTRKWIYRSRQGKRLVQVVRIDDGNGGKKVFQKHWNGSEWAKGAKGVDRAEIPLYKRSEIRDRIAQGHPIFIVEGETCADALWELGLAATTNIGGALKWHDSDTEDLAGAKTVVLCPDRDLPGIGHTEQVEMAIANRFPDIKILWYYPPFQSGWDWIPKDKGLDVADYIADYGASADDILGGVESKRDLGSDNKWQGSVNTPVDAQNPEVMGVLETVQSVRAILDRALTHWQETHELEELRSRSVLGKAAFETLVAEERAKRQQVLPEDVDRLKDLMGLEKSKLDLHRVLPQLADAIYYDARQVGCAPEFIFQNLLGAIASLIGPEVNLRVGSRLTPASLYLANVAESGLGKTQAMNLVYEPLRRWQESARQDFEGRADEFEIAIEQWRSELKEAIKNGTEPPAKPELNPERKYLMQSFSIWAVLARLKEQAEQGNGFVLARDELKAIFAFNQFSKNDTEGLELIIEQWDGNALFLDRKNATDGFYIPASRMSIVGGIQPGVYRQVFKDPDDAQGVQARFLFAVEEDRYDAEEGQFCLASTDHPGALEELYFKVRDINNWPEVQLSEPALNRWKTIKRSIERQSDENPHAAIRAWMRKLPAQILRLALVLHVLDCVENPALNRDTVSLDVIERAIEAARYYKSCFLKLQESSSYTVDTASVMFQILDLAKRSKKGLTPRDAYRKLRSLSRLARVENQKVSEFTTNLFYRLSELGLGRVQKCPRTVRLFVADTADATAAAKNGHGKIGRNGHSPVSVETESTNGSRAYNQRSSYTSPVVNSSSVHTSLENRDTAAAKAQIPSVTGFEGADTCAATTVTLADTSAATDGDRPGHGQGAVALWECQTRTNGGDDELETTADAPSRHLATTTATGPESVGDSPVRSMVAPQEGRTGSAIAPGVHGTDAGGGDRRVRSVGAASSPVASVANGTGEPAASTAASSLSTHSQTEANDGTGTGDRDETGAVESPIEWVKSRDRSLPTALQDIPLKVMSWRTSNWLEVRALGDTKHYSIPLSSCSSVSRHPEGYYHTYEPYGT